MPYCSDCGKEIEPNISLCSDCGSEINLNKKGKELAPCQKCDSDISKDAMKCPECGWEPASSGILHSLIFIICIPWVGAGLIFYLAAFAVLFTGGYSILNFSVALILITTFIAFPVLYLYILFKNADRKPTDKMKIFGQEI